MVKREGEAPCRHLLLREKAHFLETTRKKRNFGNRGNKLHCRDVPREKKPTLLRPKKKVPRTGEERGEGPLVPRPPGKKRWLHLSAGGNQPPAAHENSHIPKPLAQKTKRMRRKKKITGSRHADSARKHRRIQGGPPLLAAREKEKKPEDQYGCTRKRAPLR